MAVFENAHLPAILTLNAGSSSIKIGLFPAAGGPAFATGLIERIGDAPRMKLTSAKGDRIDLDQPNPADFADHDSSLITGLSVLRQAYPGLEVRAVGHRIVHGGATYDAPVLLNADVVARLDQLRPYAPLHQPHNLDGIHAARRAFADVPQVAAFDTAFHRAHPKLHDMYGLPSEYYDAGVRRYGFHGLSYQYISEELARSHPDLAQGRVVIAHLGNGASMCSVKAGQPVSTTMGFSALDGLAMGSRCGQMDPGVLLYLMDAKGMSSKQISDLLYKQSGLLGMSGLSNDMRTLQASDEPAAALAIDYFCLRIRREIAAMAADMGGLDALVFTGGIGEHSAAVRAQVCQDLAWAGVVLDAALNDAHAAQISTGAVRVLVMPTDEESVIAEATRRLAL